MMRLSFARTLALTAVTVGAAVSASAAHAQNTYADVPFNQGSLFYRPSGAKPPRTVTSTQRQRLLYRPATSYTYVQSGQPAVRATPPAQTYMVPTQPVGVAPGYVSQGRVMQGYAPQAGGYVRYYYPQPAPPR
jgi:hypothetical protein